MVAIVICTRSIANWTSVNSTNLHSTLIPSVQKTITTDERDNFSFEFVVGFDTGDAFWEMQKNRKDLQLASDLPISFVSIPKKKDRPFQIPFNQVCRATYEYGADYIVRVNDDSEFFTSKWATKAIKRLSEYSPPNVGVVGPNCRDGKSFILTHDFVHRTHLDIFKDYYPNEFDNWWIDDWITKVYGKQRTTQLPDWGVLHHIGKHGRRYKITPRQFRQLDMTLTRGRNRIEEFLFHNRTEEPGVYRVLGTERVDAVWGPMKELHEPSTSI